VGANESRPDGKSVLFYLILTLALIVEFQLINISLRKGSSVMKFDVSAWLLLRIVYDSSRTYYNRAGLLFGVRA
jgi:hypothetical protein